MNARISLGDALRHEVLVGDGCWVPLVATVSPDACEDCLRGVYVGHDHPECETVVPDRYPYYSY